MRHLSLVFGINPSLFDCEGRINPSLFDCEGHKECDFRAPSAETAR